MKRVSAFFLIFLYVFPLMAQVYKITDYGAIGDGITVNTVHIQQAIDKCSENGGGTVYIPAGVFISGTIELKSNVNLYLETGAVIKGSPNLNDYKPYQSMFYGASHFGIIHAHKAQNVSITGQGIIDGNDAVFFDWTKAKKIEWGGTQYTRQKENFRKVTEGIGDGPVEPKDRPRQMVIFSECRNVLVRDVQLLHAPFWTLHFADCDGVICTGLKIGGSLETPNSDGIDITSCNNVIISDCDIRTGDDAIAITGYAYHYELPGYSNLRHASANITVSNCLLQSRSSGIRIGFEDQNTVRNIQISNIIITNSNRGIGIFVRDSGSIENVNISNVFIETRLHTGDWWGNGEPIHISSIPRSPNVKTGKIRNVNFRDVTCRSEAGIVIFGLPESPIGELSFENLKLTITESPINETAGGNFDFRGCYGEKLQLFAHDIPGIYMQHVDKAWFNNVTVNWEQTQQPFFTHALEARHIGQLTLMYFSGMAAPAHASLKAVKLVNISRFITNMDKKMLVKEKD